MPSEAKPRRGAKKLNKIVIAFSIAKMAINISGMYEFYVPLLLTYVLPVVLVIMSILGIVFPWYAFLRSTDRSQIVGIVICTILFGILGILSTIWFVWSSVTGYRAHEAAYSLDGIFGEPEKGTTLTIFHNSDDNSLNITPNECNSK
jgi:hypothetical protein